MDPWQVMDTVSKSEQEPVGEEDRASMDEQVEEDVEAEEANAQEHSHDGDQNAGKKKKKKKKKKKSSKVRVQVFTCGYKAGWQLRQRSVPSKHPTMPLLRQH